MLVTGFFPVIAVVKVMRITYVSLFSVAFVGRILSLYIRMVFPWIALVHHRFIHPVPVDVSKSRRQRCSVDPCPILKINILMYVDVVIRIDIRHIIIPGMVIPNRAPIGLIANVEAYAEPHLCISSFDEETSR